MPRSTPRLRFIFLLFFLWIWHATTAVYAADATIALPLQGFYRPGRYFPVHVTAHAGSPTEKITLQADGALPTDIQASNGAIDARIPWLSIRTVGDVSWATPAGVHSVKLPLRPLDEDERLIGFAGADPDALAPLFPGKTLIRVPLDVTDPLPGETTAWESLDGIVLDATAAGRLAESTVRDLLASGAAIAIRSRQKPGGDWPWQQRGPYWSVKIDIAGPTSAYQPDAYAPTQTWLRGWPARMRRQIAIAAVIFAILATAAVLWQSRHAVWIVVGVSVLSTGLVSLWRHRLSDSLAAAGSIVIVSDAATQVDAWEYRAVLRPADGIFRWRPLGRPVFGYRCAADETAARQLCAADGKPLAVLYHLEPRQTLAFQTRILAAQTPAITPTMPVTSPLRAMADDLYVRRGDRIVGQVQSEDAEGWASVVVKRRGLVQNP